MQYLNKIQRIALYLFFFSINFEMLTPINDNKYISIAKIFGLVYFISTLTQFKLFIKLDNVKYYLFPIVIFFGLDTLMELLNVNEIASQYFNFTILLNIIFLLIMINHERKDYMILEKGMLSFAFGTILLAILYNFRIGTTYFMGRLSMFGEDQNYIAARTSVGIIVLALAITQNRLKLGWYRFLFLLALPLMVKLLFETGSRLGFISLTMSFLIAIILYKTENFPRKVMALTLGIISLFIVGIILFQSETLVNRLIDSKETGNMAGRIEIWKTLIPIIKEHPIFGIGHNGYIFQTTEIYGNEISPHNVILEILCYTGIIGLILYLVFLFRIAMTSYLSYKRYNILLPLILLIPVAGMILSIQILTLKIGWIIFAYIISSSAIQSNQNKLIT